jgi:ADP-L-glycero-D-manno-heptose 6-epimerase
MIVLTGGAGFIGSAMLWELNCHGIEDVIVVDDLGQASTGKWLNLRGLRFRDFIHKNDLPPILKENRLQGVRAVIHMGAISSTTEPDAALLMKNNFDYSKLLASWCMEHGIRFIYASSAATYGDGAGGYADDDGSINRLRPLNMYGYSKQLFDRWAMQNGVLGRAVGLKYFNVYGPNEYHKGEMKSVVCKAFSQIREGGSVSLFRSHIGGWRDGEQMRDFIYVKDCTKIMKWLLDHPEVAGIFNVGTGRSRSFNDLVRATFLAMGVEPSISYIPMPEILRKNYQYYTCADCGKLRTAGYLAPLTSLEDGIRDYVLNYLQTVSPYLDAEQPDRQTLTGTSAVD